MIMQGKIIVVEDEMAINDLIAMNLEVTGYEVVSCLDGLEAEETLKKEKDFKRSLGEEVEIRTYRAIEHQKEFVGILQEYDNDTVTIAYEDDTTQTFNRSEIALIRLALDF